MDFSLTDEQSMLVDSVARFIDNDYDFETRQKVTQSDQGFSTNVWRTFAELGWTAMPLPEEDGGLGGGPVELMLLMQHFGRGLVVEPYLANVVLAGGILRRSADAAQKTRWLSPLIAGELQATLAFTEPQSRFNIADIATTATADGKNFVLDGHKSLVLNGASADLLLIPARTSGTQQDQDGISIFAIGGDTTGVERQAYPTVDGHRAAEIRLRSVRVNNDSLLGTAGTGFAALQDTIDDATFAISAEAMGILRALHEKTVDYAKNRIQFGVPIGTFQALQHRMVDTLMGCEQCQSLLYWAAMRAKLGGSDAQSAVSALKYQIGTSGRQIAREAVQIHGGMGVTWELDIAHLFKRFTAIETLFGNADFHLDRYVQLAGQAPRDVDYQRLK
ncbi:MAG: acyl-CoA dehydrogenase family protein [Woeseia sp.]